MANSSTPGWKTSEFWLTAVANLLSLLYLAGAIGDQSTAGKIAALVAVALSNAGYTVARGKVKAANAGAVAPGATSINVLSSSASKE